LTNTILHQRIVKLISVTYAMDESFLWQCYTKLNSFDKLIDLCANGQLETIIKEIRS